MNEIENFKVVSEYIKNQLNINITLDKWTAKLLNITEETDKLIRLNCQFEFEDSSFIKELKFYYTNFQTIEAFDIEINRLLNKVDSYHNAIESLKVLSEKNSNKPLPDFGVWQGTITKYEWKALDTSLVTITFTLTDENNILHKFDKDFMLTLDNFISIEYYYQELEKTLAVLNKTLEINLNYYSSLVPNINP